MNKVYLALTIIIIGFGFVYFTMSGGSQNTADDIELDNNSLTQETTDNQEIQASTKKMEKPELTIDTSKEYTATLNTTEGLIKIKLNANQTPITVNNFVYLANNDFYDNTIFHRAVSGFMIQGGDPKGDGTGGPGYRFDDEDFEGEYTKGTVAMANAGPNTNGSQFFIMHQDYPLPPNYVIFGEVIEGQDVVDAIATADVTISPSGEMSKPVSPVTIESVEITSE